MTFNEWVMQARRVNDPIGDFVRDMQWAIRISRRYPVPLITHPSQLVSYLLGRGASDEAVILAQIVWALPASAKSPSEKVPKYT
jgi:hypothetical protein